MLTLEYDEDIARKVERQEIREEITKEVTEKIIGQVTEQSKIEIAKNLLKSKVDLNIISISTELPIEKILVMKKELGI